MISNKQRIIVVSTIAIHTVLSASGPFVATRGHAAATRVVVAGSATTVTLTYERKFDDIKDMSIADGLKVILIEHSFTSDLASILGIDEYVAKIIHNAAKEHLSPKLSEMT
jgi:hypothetical protein